MSREKYNWAEEVSWRVEIEMQKASEVAETERVEKLESEMDETDFAKNVETRVSRALLERAAATRERNEQLLAEAELDRQNLLGRFNQ